MKVTTSTCVALVVLGMFIATTTHGSILDDPRVVNTQCYWTPPDSIMTPPTSFCATPHATGLGSVRSVVVDFFGRPVVITSDGLVRMVYDTDGSGFSEEDEWVTIFNGASLGLTGGMVLGEPWMYVSSPTTVYRFEYLPLNQPTLITAYQTVITGLPASTLVSSIRALTATDTLPNKLYVSVPAIANVDTSSLTTSASIRVFALDAFTSNPTVPMNWINGTLIASGVHRPLAMALDTDGVLWSVDSGVDNLTRTDLTSSGASIRNDNPADELNSHRTEDRGGSYGAPYCFTEGTGLDRGLGSGTQWSINNSDTAHNDVWCRDTTTNNNIAPMAVLPAHSTPSGIVWYANINNGWSFPAEYQGTALITLHGSDASSRDTPQAAKVVRVKWSSATDSYVVSDFLTQNGTSHRPTSVVVGVDGEVWITSDTSGTLFVVRYLGVAAGANKTVNIHNSMGGIEATCSSCGIAPAVDVPWYEQRSKMAEGGAIAVIVILVLIILGLCGWKRRKDRLAHDANISQLTKSTGGRVRDIEMGSAPPMRTKRNPTGAPRAGLR